MEEAIEELEGAEEQQNIDLPEDPIERAVMLGHEHALKPDQQAELNRRILMRSMHEHQLRLSRYLPQFVEAFRFATSPSHVTLATAAAAVVAPPPPPPSYGSRQPTPGQSPLLTSLSPQARRILPEGIRLVQPGMELLQAL